MRRRESLPSEPVYFSPHPGLQGPHEWWEED